MHFTVIYKNLQSTTEATILKKLSNVKLQSLNNPLTWRTFFGYRFSNNLIAVACACYTQRHTQLQLQLCFQHSPTQAFSPHAPTFIFIDTTTLILSELAVVGSSNRDVWIVTRCLWSNNSVSVLGIYWHMPHQEASVVCKHGSGQGGEIASSIKDALQLHQVQVWGKTGCIQRSRCSWGTQHLTQKIQAGHSKRCKSFCRIQLWTVPSHNCQTCVVCIELNNRYMLLRSNKSDLFFVISYQEHFLFFI